MKRVAMHFIMAKHEVKAQLLADIMEIAETNAIDGWADIVTFLKTEDPELYKMDILELDPPSEDNENGDVQHHTVTVGTILLGMERIVHQEIPPADPDNAITTLGHIREWIITSIKDDDATMIDSYCANAIIQYALFNRQVYS
jgi:hypothetical protein